MSEATAVNAAGDDDGSVVLSFRIDGEWQTIRLARGDAITLADMLRLITRTTD